MKTRHFITACILILSSITTYAQEGVWKGELDIQGNKLPLMFNFNPDGCTIDSPLQGAKGIPAQKSIAEDGTIKVEIPSIGATFEGKKDGASINGTFKQSGFSFPLTLTSGKFTVNRPQTPKPPFPYNEESVSFKNCGYTFNGTLTLPKDYTKETPVVLMVTGSGQQNRDEELFSHKPFAVIADALARNGIASLRYDDRGWDDSSAVFANFTTDDFKKDAEAGLELLRKRFNKVGILGHSEGGTIALILAAEGKTDFIVSLAGMAVSGKATLLAQNRNALTASGVPTDMTESYIKTLDRVFNELAAGKKTNEISLEGIPAALKLPFEEAIKQVDNAYIRHFIGIDMSGSLQKIKCPVLALNGTKDMQVDSKTNIGALEKGLTECKHTLKTMEGLNHLFQHCQTGSISEYQQIEETISPEVLNIISGWINELK